MRRAISMLNCPNASVYVIDNVGSRRYGAARTFDTTHQNKGAGNMVRTGEFKESSCYSRGWQTSAAVFLLSAVAFGQADRPAVPVHSDPVVQGVQKHIDRLCAEQDARLAAIRSEADLKQVLGNARRRLLERMGIDIDSPRSVPPAKVVGSIPGAGYHVEKVIVESAPGVPVPCVVYVPTSGPARKPAILSPHGHSGRDRPVYQNACQRLARAGFLVLTKDGWGKQERRSTGHGEDGGQLSLTGGSLLGLEVFDNVRCIDYLLNRADVDADRLAMAGLSGGGSQTLYTAAVDGRLKAASPTGAVTTFRADLADTTMCVCEMLPDILTIGDHGLFLAMAYPRPVLIVNGTRDPIFPIAGARFAAGQARSLYAIGGKADRMEFAEFDDVHTWSDAMIDRQVQWLRKQFGLPTEGEMPPADGFRPYEQLRGYPDGDLPAGSLTLGQIGRQRMMTLLGTMDTGARGRSLADDAARLSEMVSRRWSCPATMPKTVSSKEIGPDEARMVTRERLSWPSGLGGSVSITISRPLSGDAAAAARLVVRLDRRRQMPRIEQLYWDDQIRAHATVADVDYTGAALDPKREAQVAAALAASGRSLLAERVRDLVTTVQVLEHRGLCNDKAKLTLVGNGFDGVLLMVAGPLLPVDARLVVDRAPITWLSGTEIDFSTAGVPDPPIHWTILPDLGRRQDLAELLELARPRKILLLHPLNSAQVPMETGEWNAVARNLTRTDRSHLEVLSGERTRAESLARLSSLIARADERANP